MQVKYGPYSPSRLEVALCPHRFKGQYIDKTVKDEGSVASRRGNVVHETFEELTKGWLVDKPLNWDDVISILTKKMAEYLITEEDAQKVCIDAARCYMMNPPQKLDTILGTEEQIAVKYVGNEWTTCEWDDPDAFARGKIDILMIDDDNIATILDHKTQMYICTADTFQMGFYAWMVKIAYPYVEAVNTQLHFCHPSLNFYSKPFLWDKDMLDGHFDHIRVAVGIAENMVEYPAIPNHNCQYCPIKMECPRLKKLRARRSAMKGAIKGPLISAKEAKGHAEVLTVLEENSKLMKSSLKTFVQEIGSVQLPGIEYAMIASESYTVPMANRKDLIAKLGEYGLNPYAFLDFSATNLKKLWRSLDENQLKAVQDLLEPKKTTSFRSRKV